MIVAGGTSYPREYDFVKFREIADEIGSLLMMDMVFFLLLRKILKNIVHNKLYRRRLLGL